MLHGSIAACNQPPRGPPEPAPRTPKLRPCTVTSSRGLGASGPGRRHVGAGFRVAQLAAFPMQPSGRMGRPPAAPQGAPEPQPAARAQAGSDGRPPSGRRQTRSPQSALGGPGPLSYDLDLHEPSQASPHVCAHARAHKRAHVARARCYHKNLSNLTSCALESSAALSGADVLRAATHVESCRIDSTVCVCDHQQSIRSTVCINRYRSGALTQ